MTEMNSSSDKGGESDALPQRRCGRCQRAFDGDPGLFFRISTVITLTGVTLEPSLIQPVIDACLAYKLIAHPLTASDVIVRS